MPRMAVYTTGGRASCRSPPEEPGAVVILLFRRLLLGCLLFGSGLWRLLYRRGHGRRSRRIGLLALHQLPLYTCGRQWCDRRVRGRRHRCRDVFVRVVGGTDA